MTAVSKTITITNTEYESLATLAEITMENGKAYTIQAQNYGLLFSMQVPCIAYVKIADAEFALLNETITITQLSDTVYIKVENNPVKVAILENA